jgi:hypothetical protein
VILTLISWSLLVASLNTVPVSLPPSKRLLIWKLSWRTELRSKPWEIKLRLNRRSIRIKSKHFNRSIKTSRNWKKNKQVLTKRSHQKQRDIEKSPLSLLTLIPNRVLSRVYIPNLLLMFRRSKRQCKRSRMKLKPDKKNSKINKKQRHWRLRLLRPLRDLQNSVIESLSLRWDWPMLL